MESVSLSTIEGLAATAANSDDLQFTHWKAISSATSIDAASVNIAGLVIGALCKSVHPNDAKWPRPLSSITQTIELRERLVFNLLKCAVHDFHRDSSTHLFFGFYSASGAVRAFHTFKDKAFTSYLIESGKLAVENEVATISEWNAFLEEPSERDASVVSVMKDPPCSGVINFRVSPALERKADATTSDVAISFNRLSALVFDEAIPRLDRAMRKGGLRAVEGEIRRFNGAIDPRVWRQKTVRIPKSSQAVLIGIAHELSISTSALATYLFNRYILSSSLVKPLRQSSHASLDR